MPAWKESGVALSTQNRLQQMTSFIRASYGTMACIKSESRQAMAARPFPFWNPAKFQSKYCILSNKRKVNGKSAGWNILLA